MTEAEQNGRNDGRGLRFLLPKLALRGGVGSRLGSRAGDSLEFQDYRDYAPGDDLRNLDWNILARTEREVVKIRREEVAPVIEVFRDRSASMEVPPAKTDCADWLFGLVSESAEGCRVIYREHPVTPRAVRLFVSDTLVDEDPSLILGRMAHGAAALAVIRILSKEETDPEPGGAFELADAETGERREITFDADTLAHHRAALEAHTARWSEAARRFNAAFVCLAAESPRPERISSLAAASLVQPL